MTGFSGVAVFDPSVPLKEGENPIDAGLPTRDDMLELGCVDSLVEGGVPNVSLNDSCHPELLDVDTRRRCVWVLLPNTLECHPIADLDFPDEEPPPRPPTTTTLVPPPGSTAAPTTTEGPTDPESTTTSTEPTTTEVPRSTSAPTSTGSTSTTGPSSTTTVRPRPPPLPIIVDPCPPSAEGLFDGRNEKSVGAFENICDPQAPAYIDGGLVNGLPVPFFRKGGGELGYVAPTDDGWEYVKCFQRNDYDVAYSGISIVGDRITIEARGAEFAALGRTYTRTYTWPGCAEIAGETAEFGQYEQRPHGPERLFEGVEYSVGAEGAQVEADAEYGIGTRFRLTDEDDNELVLNFPEEVIFDQFSVVARHGDDLFVFAAAVNRPPGQEPGPDHDQGKIYRVSPGETGTGTEVTVAVEVGRISSMIVVDEVLWLAQLEPSRIIPVPLDD